MLFNSLQYALFMPAIFALNYISAAFIKKNTNKIHTALRQPFFLCLLETRLPCADSPEHCNHLFQCPSDRTLSKVQKSSIDIFTGFKPQHSVHIQVY